MEPTERFSSRAAYYALYRPGYPEEVVDTLESEAGLSPGATVADIGSGTGISSELFLRRGYAVIGVEPNASMRAEAARRLGGNPAYWSLSGRAEATGLPAASINLVLCAQSFHWFRPAEARSEFLRLLKPQGLVAVLWNLRRTEGSEFNQRIESLLLRYCPNYANQVRGDTEKAILAIHDLFGTAAVRKRTFRYAQSLDLEGLKGRLLSASYVPLPGDPNHEPLIRELEQIFTDCNAEGRVTMEYDTVLYWARPL